MVVPLGSAVIVAWDASVGGIEYSSNVETGVVYAHTDDDHHLIRFDNPKLRMYDRHRWPLSRHERGRTWDHLIVIDGMESDAEEDWVPVDVGVPTLTAEERMIFVLERPSSRETAVHAMRVMHIRT